MPLSFPSNPSVGATSTQNGRQYVYRGNNVWELASGSGGEDTLLRSLFVPPAPTSVSATAGNAQATVSWTAPGGVISQAPITDYTVQYSSNSGSTWTTFTRTASTATSATVTGLTNGTAYQFRVTSVNAIGQGPWSTASSAVTPTAGDPYWSYVQLLLPGDTSVNDASSYNRSVSAVGGATVSTAQKRFGAGSIYFDGSGDYLTIPSSTALDFGGDNFVVEAWFKTSQVASGFSTLVNREWVSSPWSNGWSIHILPNNTIEIFATSHSTGSPILNGSTPCRDGNWHHFAWVRSGSSHKLFLDGALDASATSSASFTAAVKDITVGGNLTFDTAGRAYNGYIDDLRITVNSDRGYTGTAIPVPTAAFPAPVSAPTSLTATAGNAQVSLTWTAPAYNGGSAITGYRVEYTPSGGSPTVVSTGSTSTSYTLTGLTNGTAYTVRVAGANANGVGTYTAASSAVTPSAGTPPGAPTGLTATAGNAQISLAWTAPSSVGSSAITGYSVEYTPSGGSAVTVNTGGTATSYTLTGLTNGTAYTARVAAVNAAGTGTYTAASSSVTPSAASVPGAPTNLGFGSPSCNSGTFVWTAPASNGGSAITGYRLRGSVNNYATFTAASSTSIAGSRQSFAGLDANTWTVRVSAVNSVGEGPYVAFTMLDDNYNGFYSSCG